MSTAGVGYLAAFGGGIVSFAPAYLSIVTGLETSELTAGARRHLGRIARDTGLFITGFSAVFITLGLTATTLGRGLVRHQAALTRISGLLVLTMALFLAGSLVLRLPWLYQERRFHPQLSRFGPFTAPVAGAAFGFGWTPCIGPVLGSVLAVAATRGRAAEGAGLLTAYSAGLGLPFLAAGLGFGRLIAVFGWVKRHHTGITLASALVLAGFGVLLTLDRLTWVTDAPVITVTVGGLTRAYPLAILEWHEVVDDTIAGHPVAITYCPLCNTAVVYDRRAGRRLRTLQTSGALDNGALVLIDPTTRQLWLQLSPASGMEASAVFQRSPARADPHLRTGRSRPVP